MNNILRNSLVFAALAAAVASQAFTVNYVGNGSNVPVGGTFTTTSLGYLGDDFNFATSVTTSALSQVVLYDALGTSGLTLTYSNPQVVGDRFSASATAVGFGNYANLSGSGLDIVRNRQNSYVISVQGSVQAVPEPASMVALSVGALGLLRRRKRA